MEGFALAVAFGIPFLLALRMIGKWLIRKGSEMERSHGREDHEAPDVPDNPFSL